MLRPFPGIRGARSGPFSYAVPVALALTMLYATVRTAYADVSVGGSSGSFLQFEVGGRPSGMGGAQVGSASGVMAQYWNPAALASLQQPEVGAMHAAWLQDLKYEWIGYARPVSPKLGVGSASIAYFHLPSIDGVDEFGNPTGEFKVYDMALTVGLARPIGHGISVGANLKAIRQTLATVSAMGPALDLGAMATVAGTSVGIVAQNLGPSLSYSGSTSYPLPRQYRFGVSRPVANGRVLLATDYNMPSDYYDDIRLGAEVRAHPNVSVRLGYRHEFGAGDDPANGISYGLGINFRQMNVDYAMTPDNDFADVHRLSFGYSFGSGVREKEPQPKKPKETRPAPPPAPTGPAVIARTDPKPAAPKPTKPAEESPKAETPKAESPKAVAIAPALPPPAGTQPAAPQVSSAPPIQEAPKPEPKPAPATYVVLLPGFTSKQSAEAEVRALDLLGFKTKDAKIEKDPKRGGYMITLAHMKSKGKADEMATSLHRMSFRAIVDVAQK